MTQPSLGVARLRTQLDVSGLRAGLDTARSNTERIAGTIEQRLDRAGQRLQDFGRGMSLHVTAPIIAAGTAAVTAVVQLGRYADSILDAAEATGLTTERIQEYRAVTRAAQVPQEALQRGAISLTRRLRQIEDDGGAAAAAMRQLGLDVETANLPLDDMDKFLPLIFDKLIGVESATTRNRIAVDLFGRSYDQLAPVLGMTADEMDRVISKARESGEVMDRETLRAAAAASREFDELRNSFGLVWRDLSIELIPTFQTVAEIVRDPVLPAARDLIGHVQTAVEWFNNLDETSQRVILASVGIAAAIGPVSFALGGLIRTLRTVVPLLATLGGPAGILIAAATAFYALNRAMDAGAESRRQLQQNFDDLVGRMRTYRSELAITSEEERQRAIEALERQRTFLERTVEMQRAFIRSVEADVIAFAERGFFGQLFTFMGAQVDLRALEQAEGQLQTLERDLASIDTQISEVRALDLTVDPPPGGTQDDPFAGVSGSAESAAGAIGEVEDRVTSLGEALDKVLDPREGFTRWLAGVAEDLGLVADDFEELLRHGAAFDFRRPVPTFEPTGRVRTDRIQEQDRERRERERAERVEALRVRASPRVIEAQLELQRLADPDAIAQAMAARTAEALRTGTDRVVSLLGDGFTSLVEASISVIEDGVTLLAPTARRLNERREREAAREERIAQQQEEAARRRMTASQAVIDAHNQWTESLQPAAIAASQAAESAARWTSEIERLLLAQERHQGLLAATEPDQFFEPGAGLNLRMIFDPTREDVIDFQETEDNLDELLARQAVRFGENMARAVATGDFPRAIQGAVQQAAGIGGQALTAAIPGPAGILAGGAVGIVGTLLSGIFGGAGQQPQAARTEAEARAARAAPAITLSAVVNQTNHIEQGIDAPQTRAQLRELARDVAGELLREIGADELLRQARGAA